MTPRPKAKQKPRHKVRDQELQRVSVEIVLAVCRALMFEREKTLADVRADVVKILRREC